MNPVMVRRFVALEKRAEEFEGEDDRLVSMLLATEAPVNRGGFDEVLLCRPENCDMSFFASGRAPLCVDHDLREQRGVFRSAMLDGQQLRATAYVSKNPKGEEELRDIRDGVRACVSVGYMILDAKYIPNPEGRDQLVVTSWRPMEGSLCAIGLDEASGIGRSTGNEFPQELLASLKQRAAEGAKAEGEEEPEADPEDMCPEGHAAEATEEPASAPEPECAAEGTQEARGEIADETEPAPEAPAAKANAEPTETIAPETPEHNAAPARSAVVAETRTVMDEIQKERTRSAEITGLGAKYKMGDIAQRAIAEGTSVEDFKNQVIAEQERRTAATAIPGVDLNALEERNYSLSRAIGQIMAGQWRKGAGFERELHDHLGNQGHVVGDRSIVVPWNLFGRATSITTGTAQHLVPQQHTQLLPFLISSLALVRAGVKVLSGLRGDVDFPSGLSLGTASTTTETGSLSDSEATFANLRASAKSIRTIATYSRTLFQNSDPSIDRVLEDALRDRIQIKLENQSFIGTGSSGQLQGLDTKTGVSDVTVGGIPSYEDWLAFLTALDDANALRSNAAFVTSMGVAVKGLSTYRDSGNSSMSILSQVPGMTDQWLMDGFNVFRSSEVKKTYPSPSSPSQLVAHAMYCGDWSKAYYGFWGGGVEITVDPYTALATDEIRIVASLGCDFIIPQGAFFARADDALIS